MTNYQILKEQNKHLQIKPITDESFGRYGVTVEVDAQKMMDALKGRIIGKGYLRSDPLLEETGIFNYFRNACYGGMPIQAGICAGDNTRLNCLEYHRGTEINIAATDMVLLLAHIGDLEDAQIESRKLEAFYLPKGQCIALFETTLHFAPLSVFKSGFVCIVLLPRGTNGELDIPFKPCRLEDRLLFKRNKWLIGHKDSEQVRDKNAFCGILGENIMMTPLEEEL